MKKNERKSVLSRISKVIPGQGMEDIFTEVKRANRRQPLFMLGGALLTGFLVTKLLKTGNGAPGQVKDSSADWDKKGDDDHILARDQSGPVSVSAKDRQGDPSYTYNAEKSEPIDPHLSDKNPPGRTTGERNVEGDVLDRDKSGQVSVSAKDRQGDPSYTYNAEKSEPIDPNLADQSAHAREGGDANVLDRDQPGPVSVSAKDRQGDPSYTHNAEKSEPIDPHLSDKNKPDPEVKGQKAFPGKKEAEDKVLERDQPGPVSVKADRNTKKK